MKSKLFLVLIVLLSFCNCSKNNSKSIVGTWRMFYAESIENDSVIIKNLDSTSFIKIINDNHFAFFNQTLGNQEVFYGGGGSYTLEGDKYTEVLNYTSVKSLRNHSFPFTVKIKGDTLIQSGIEFVKKANLNRKIIEKYIRVKQSK